MRGGRQPVTVFDFRCARQLGHPEHPGRLDRPPRIGEHNAEVYGEFGYGSDDLGRLR